MFYRLRSVAQNLISDLPGKLILYYLLFVLANQGLQFFISQRIASTLGSKAVGLHYLLLSYVSTLLVVTTIGSSTAIIKYISSPKSDQRLESQYIINALLISLLIAVLIYFIYPYLPTYIIRLLFPNFVLKILIQQANLYLVLYTVETVLVASLIANKWYKILASVATIRFIIIGCFLYENKIDLIQLWQLMCLGSSVVILLYIISLYSLFKNTFHRGFFSYSIVKKLLADSWTYLFASLLVSPSLFFMNRIVSENSAGLAALGVYTICKQYANMNSMVVSQFSQSFFPVLNHQFHTNDVEGFEKLTQRGLILGLAVVSAGAFFLSITGPIFIFSWYKWQITPLAVFWYCLTIISSIVAFLNQYFGNLLVIIDRQQDRFWADTILAFVLVIMCYLTINRWPNASPFVANFFSISIGGLCVWIAYQRRKHSFLTEFRAKMHTNPAVKS